MRSCLRWILPALAFAASTASAQRQRTSGALAVEFRQQMGELPDSVDSRRGLAIRIQADFPWKKYASWRLEGSYIQVKYSRGIEGDDTKIRETDFEASGFLRLMLPQGSKPMPYLLAGTVGSLRGSCDLSNAFSYYDSNTRCTDGEDYRIGWGAGAGVQLPSWIAGWRWFLEGRVLSNITSAAGGRLFVVSIGAGQ